MKEEHKEIRQYLQEKGSELMIPERVQPEQIRQLLKKSRKKRLFSILKAAACFCLAIGLLYAMQQATLLFSAETPMQTERQKAAADQNPVPEILPEEKPTELAFSKESYEQIYAQLSSHWQTIDQLSTNGIEEDALARAESESVKDLATPEQKQQVSEDAFGRTNTQVQEIEEADQIKNDGRYLYQIASKTQTKEDGNIVEQTGIQILDTEDGLTEVAFLDDFEQLEEFHLWEDLLITVENKAYDLRTTASSAKKTPVYDLLYRDPQYHEIRIYQIADRSHPKKLKTFTLQGSYETSRIAEGYFYEISSFTASPGDGAEDYDAYIPSLDGTRMEAEQIDCPPEANGSSYLVLISIDLSNPSALADSKAILAGSGTYYVSPQNIYVAWYQSIYEQEPENIFMIQDKTRFLRIFYQNGHFYTQAEGETPGRIHNSFSMDESNEHLRVVTTVQKCFVKKITDERTGEELGYDYGEVTESNALYILDSALAITGRIEGLAEGETIRSARFLGDTGYFVTFRQTDPLFAVDLSNPEHPVVLGELKVSGFSEYLHIYGENRLLGIGMEADESTGQEQGMKLSMFDISDPLELKEVAKLPLKDYNYSEALWDHRAVLVDTQENLFGFLAEGSQSGDYWKDYLLFSYQDDAFVQTLKIDTLLEDPEYHRVHGTFIGNTFYLLFDNGMVRAYDMERGTLLEEYICLNGS